MLLDTSNLGDRPVQVTLREIREFEPSSRTKRCQSSSYLTQIEAPNSLPHTARKTHETYLTSSLRTLNERICQTSGHPYYAKALQVKNWDTLGSCSLGLSDHDSESQDRCGLAPLVCRRRLPILLSPEPWRSRVVWVGSPFNNHRYVKIISAVPERHAQLALALTTLPIKKLPVTETYTPISLSWTHSLMFSSGMYSSSHVRGISSTTHNTLAPCRPWPRS